MDEDLRFELRMLGDRVSPASVRVQDLASLLLEFDNAIAAMSKKIGLPGAAIDPSMAHFCLVDIQSGSSRLIFGLSSLASKAVAAISIAVASGNLNRIPSDAAECMQRVSDQAIKKGWVVAFVPDPRQGIQAAEISAKSPISKPVPYEFEATTTLYGTVNLLGGVQPRCVLVTYSGDKVSIQLTMDQVQQIKNAIYEDVSIDGIAVYDGVTMKVKYFTAKSILPFDPHPDGIDAAFRDLAAAAGGRWDGVDAEKYVRELRRDDDEGEAE